jgi:hypothetical protein
LEGVAVLRDLRIRADDADAATGQRRWWRYAQKQQCQQQ